MDNELKEFIEETLRQIDEGVGESHNVQNTGVEFDIAISKRVEKGGKVGVTVLGQGIGGEATVMDEKASRVKFTVKMNRKSEQKKFDAQLAKAQATNENNREKMSSRYGL